MVTIDFQGRTGNRIIQYCAARLFAERNGLQLVTALPEADRFLEPTPHKPGIYDASATELVLSQNTDVLKLVAPGRFVFRGFFQDWRWLHAHRDQILTFFERDIGDYLQDPDAIAVHMRFGDYAHTYGSSRIISLDWYRKILCQERFKEMVVFTDDPFHAHVKQLMMEYRPACVDMARNSRTAWKSLKTFGRIIVGNSTFSWVAAYFRPGVKAWTFRPWVSLPEIDLAEYPGWEAVDGAYETVPNRAI